MSAAVVVGYFISGSFTRTHDHDTLLISFYTSIVKDEPWRERAKKRNWMQIRIVFFMCTFPSYCALAGSGATFGLGFHLRICGKKTTTSSICFFFLVFVLKKKQKNFICFWRGSSDRAVEESVHVGGLNEQEDMCTLYTALQIFSLMESDHSRVPPWWMENHWPSDFLFNQTGEKWKEDDL